MSFPWIRSGAWAGTALLAVALVGCGDSDNAGSAVPTTPPASTLSTTTTPPVTSTTPAPPDLSALPADTLLARTKAAAAAAPGLRVKGRLTDGTGEIRLDLQMTGKGGQGRFVVGGVPVTYRVVGKNVYMLMSEETIRAMAKAEKATRAETSAMLKLMTGKWLKPSKIDADGRSLIEMVTRDSFFRGFFSDVGRPVKAGKKVVDGVPSVGLRSDGATLWVDIRTARPVRFETDGAHDFMTFTDYGKVPAPKAPPATLVLDGKDLGI